MATEDFFEGAEKLLEIWFGRQDGKVENGDLRKIPREKYEDLLKAACCEVISYTSNDEIDAYVLSESSMFVTKRRFILKTCGTTTPIECIKPLLLNVHEFTGFDEVEDVFYSRKNFERPELQKDTYRNFKLEIESLNIIFKGTGVARCLRSSKTDDSWYLYALHPVECFGKEKQNPDQTLEILMTNLDPDVMQIFTKEQSANANQATQDSGISELLPNMKIDDFLFDPCGYSMNGIAKEGHYMTIHITPQQEFSYVSFETNVPQSSYKELILKVLKTFQPEKCVLTMFTNEVSPSKSNHKEFKYLTQLGEWQQDSNKTCSLKNHDLTVSFYSKYPS
ncbi:S-adenosylmethionine decarboxylase proenzyme 2 [Aphis gossypii]|uniref:S-adenosylmethionine decarboxylase proenzyme 2 n=1 Tax=Aphis gossypii TaxID=80765 RepID=UPI002159A32E|nr:S-adenosylmethionine decarboxylase proenzyme 2 [Aphis gossypii]XP_027842805.2 S-adenosylmethionine decarboxylase proenzyme 2 [Aphis gossypii]XP_050059149.1 S-adenosylmethionine decarboxylase proenzyme 2 [Aphis gossypii]